MLNFIVNPFSGGKEGKKTRKNLAEISNYLSEKNIDYNFYFTERKGHAVEITRDLIKNFKKIDFSLLTYIPHLYIITIKF